MLKLFGISAALLLLLASLVYFGEHWVIDGLVGWTLVGLSFLFWNRAERWMRQLRAARARADWPGPSTGSIAGP